MPVSFDGANLLITLDRVGTFEVDAELYSDWKEWAKTGNNTKYPPAFAGSTGGEATKPGEFVAPYFFLRNDLGWRIRPFEANGEIIFNGNLFPADAAVSYIVPTLGGYTVLVRGDVSSKALVEETGTSGLTTDEAQLLYDLRTLMRGKKITRLSDGTYVVLNLGFTDPAAPGAIFAIANELFEDEDETQPYRRQGIEVIGELVDP